MANEYYYSDGKPYSGPVCTLPDGRIVSGKTYTTESRRVHTIETLPVKPVVETPKPAPKAAAKKEK